MKTKRNKDRVGQIYTVQTEQTHKLFKSVSSTQKKRLGIGCIRGLTPKRNSSAGKIVIRPCTPKKTCSIQVQTNDIIPIMQAKGIQVQVILDQKINRASCQMGKTTQNRINYQKFIQSNYVVDQNIQLSNTLKVKYQNKQNKQNKESPIKKSLIKNQSQKDSKRNPSLNQLVQKNLSDNKNTKDCNKEIKNNYTNLNTKQNIDIKNSRVDRKQRQVDKYSKTQNYFKGSTSNLNNETMKIQSKYLGQDRSQRFQKISKLSALYEKNLARYQSSKGILGDLLNNKKVSI